MSSNFISLAKRLWLRKKTCLTVKFTILGIASEGLNPFSEGEVAMRNYFYKLLLLVMVLAVSGCGGGGSAPPGSAATGSAATTADPLGTDTLSSVTASTASLAAGESSIITATVKHADGRAATGREVSFSFFANKSNGKLTVTADGSSNGTASATYTAGSATPATDLQDIIRVSIGNGASTDVVITRKGSTTPPASATILSLSPSLTSLSAGENSIITANVADSAGTPLAGVTVTFSLPVKNSGSPTLSAESVVTDSSGNAVTIYLPGTASPTASVNDIVQASLATGSTKLATINRKAGTGTTTVEPYAVSIITSSASVTAGQVSIITATVTSGTASASGITVTFTIPVNSSGATFPASTTPLSATVTTDGTGKAVVVYQPGKTNSDWTVQDTVQAAVGTSTSAVVITRVASVASAVGIVVTASPATLTHDNSSSVIKATVTSGTTAISGIAVAFTVVGSGGTISSGSATTDGSGNAVITFTGGPPVPAVVPPATTSSSRVAGQTDIVTASISIDGNTYANAVVITYP